MSCLPANAIWSFKLMIYTCNIFPLTMCRESDVAVVKIDTSGPLPCAHFGDSTDLHLGAWVIALGSPLMLRHSVTAGIVSCVERQGSELGLSTGATAGALRRGFIQTDASINQGSSGGPLCNLDGEVIGLNNLKAYAADGVSFAIPIDLVRAVVRQFHHHGRVKRPFVGLTLSELDQGVEF